MQNDNTHKHKVKTLLCMKFWCGVRKTYREQRDHAGSFENTSELTAKKLVSKERRGQS